MIVIKQCYEMNKHWLKVKWIGLNESITSNLSNFKCMHLLIWKTNLFLHIKHFIGWKITKLLILYECTKTIILPKHRSNHDTFFSSNTVPLCFLNELEHYTLQGFRVIALASKILEINGEDILQTFDR